LAVLLDGKKVAQELKERIKSDVAQLKNKAGKAPVLACLSVGQNAASSVYIRSQGKVAEELGVEYRLSTLKEGISQESLVAEICNLNADPGVHGIIVQTPLPGGMNLDEVVGTIAPKKDAEGMHPENLGKLLLGQNRIAPCTAQACMELMHYYKIKLRGKEVVIVGHSEIVGKPLSLLLLKEFATVTVCHIATSEAHKLVDHVARAEVLIVAVGRAHLIKGEWVKDGAVVVDVGINRVGDKIIGDVEFESAEKKAAYITPVPGGVGPLTVAMLMKNVVTLSTETLK
jgi:methylenetetrahydrofolate dehydrogenase (NADP+)/methenyltetrahydrofolate cyclohydrolase